MPPGYPKGRSVKSYDFLGGGLVTRPDDRYVNLLNDQGHFYSPAETNVQFTKIGSMQKRLGYTQVGSDVQNAVWFSNTTSSGVLESDPLDNSTLVNCFKKVAGSTAPIISASMIFQLSGGVNQNFSYITDIKLVIKADNAGVPGTTLSTSNALNDAYETPHATLTPTNFYFPSPVTLTNGVTYWFCLQMTCLTGAVQITLDVFGTSSPGAGIALTSSNGYSSYQTFTNFSPRMLIYSSNKPVLGLYDYRPQSGGVVTQFVMTAVNGTLYYESGGAYTSIATGLGATANTLYDFSTLKNLLFSCDYATSNNQAWDGAAAATMTHGYRGTFTTAASNSSGGPWSNSGAAFPVKVMLVTALRSGGLRCSAVGSQVLGSTTQKVDLGSIAVDAIAGQFSFDIGSAATSIYCTIPGGSIFYLVPKAQLSTSTSNPIPNTQTSNSILPTADATLIAGGSFETNTGYPQGYATGQVNTPKAKFMEVFQNMLATAGDPNNPSRVWLSEQFAPQVFGDGSSGTGIQGDFLDIAVDDGEQVTGLAVSDGALMVGKQTSIYRVDFTGNASNSWSVRKVHGQVGVLSNWSMQIIPDGLFFLSERGPAICYGTYSDVLPQTRMIQNLFDNTAAESFDLDSMIYTVACNDTTRNQILMTVSSPGVTIRDRILSYDYEQKMFGLYDGYQANYLATIGDSNGFPVLWNGNLSGQVFQRSLITSGTPYYDNGAAIITSFSTPNIDLGDPATFSQPEFFYLNGKVQTSGNLYIDLFANGSATAFRTISVDMTSAIYGLALPVRLGAIVQSLKIRFRSVDFTGVSGFELHWLRLEYSDASGTRMG